MPYSRNTFIDFDGTLVLENSSIILMETLLSRASARSEKLLVRVFDGRIRRAVKFGLAVFTRLSGERDVALLLVLWSFRKTLAKQGEDVYSEVASKLTLNPRIANEYRQPFSIASTGLRPVIEAFLTLHPDLPCAGVYTSGLHHPGSSKLSVRLLSVRNKMKTIDSFMPTVYYTDYIKEVALFDRISQLPFTVKVIEMPDGKDIYKLSVKK